MAPATHDFVSYAGATFYATIQWRDDDGVPIPLGGYTARLEVRGANGTLLVALTTENGGLGHRDDGGLSLWRDDDATRLWPPGYYRYDLLLRDPAALVPDPLVAVDYVLPLMQGKWTVKPLVTTTEPIGDTP